jgi:helix-turn-helix, Psq domain
LNSRLARILAIEPPPPMRAYQRRPEGTDLGTYHVWASMKDRCDDPENAHYHGRGIAVCARWRESFPNFVEDMGNRPDGLWLDRINNDGNYEPGNCRWTTPLIQENNRSNNLPITALGRTQNVSEWAREFGISYSTLWCRYRRGAAVELLNALSEASAGTRKNVIPTKLSSGAPHG